LSELFDRLEREPPDFFSMPRLYDQDPELLAVSEILLPLGNAAFISRPALAPLIVIRALELSLERQLLPESIPVRIAAAGLYANAILGKVDVAYAFGETAIELASQAAFHTTMCSPLHIQGRFIHFWRKPLRETLNLFDRALQSAHDCGNNECASYAMFSWSSHAFYASIELAQVEERSLRLRAFVDGIQYVTQSRWVNIIVTAAQTLRESSPAHYTSWRGTPFDDGRDLPDMNQFGDQLGLLFAYCAKAWVATLFGDHDGVEEYSELSCSFLEAGHCGLESAIVAFVCGLRHARELRENSDRLESEQALQEQLGLLERIAGLAPMNFAHKLSLVQAEVHRARGEVLQAMQTYEQAGQGAWENGYLSEAGLAHALAAEFFQDLGLHQAALHNAEQAVQAWRSWGAHALVGSLGRRLPDLLGPSDLSWKSASAAGKVHTSITPIQMDMESIISTSQMLSAETDLEQLLTKLMTSVMASSGAENVVLLLKQDNVWFVQARGDSTSEKHEILLNQPFDTADRESDLIPEPVFNYCRRSKEVLIVGDTQRDHRFAEDRMIQKHNIKSMACIPALNRGELKAMLYLENRQMPDIFTLERVEILKHLSSQFGVSVENALLYENLTQAEAKYRTVADFTYDWEYWANLDGTLNYVSPSCERISGYSVKDFMDNPSLFREIIVPQDREMWDRHYRDSRQEPKPRDIQFRIQRRDGQIRWIEHACQPVTDVTGRYIGFRASNRDITDRKKAEIELRGAYEEIEQLKNQLEAESAYLQDEIKLEHNFENIVGKSESLKYVLNRVEKVAPTDSPVLIMGETGTGKELVARALHELSPHGKRALVKVNCAALPGELIESELFGREKGAFTGATTTQLGRFELAKGSTLFLDEIGELPLELQAKLLRVLESGEFERLGSSRTLHSNARIIAATNRVLEEEIRKGRFREDLWYRLKVFPITVPPLREHPEDIPMLVKWFVDQLARKMGKRVAEIPKRTMQLLQNYPWPGNVRELKHAIESALINAQGKKLNFELPKISDSSLKDFKSLEEMERDYILRILKAKNWRIGSEDGASSILRMPSSTLRSRMKKLGIKRPS
jgi:chemotaxis protein methyltransferase CheR